ncbi:alkylation response protein AidB-like acyl-CoA dehydrogenase [Catenulispora sp. MAP12-49]|uniref:acyl-CoA dehydrogenase family protein n=1 Tax=unclassified Catenulispora TaxID=414885 RepID=UPI00351982B5
MTADGMIEFLRQYSDSRLDSWLMDERRSLPPSLVSHFGAEGLLGLRVDRKYGGQELSYTDTFRVIRQAAAIDPNLAVLLVVHNSLGIPPIRDFADEETKQRVLPVLATGRGLTTVATSEPGMGSNVVRGMTATAVRQADRSFIINGDKSWISLGAASTYITVLARLQEPNGRKKGITAFLLPTSTPGFRPRSEAMTIGLRAIPQDHIALENMRVPASAVLGPEGGGAAVAQNSFRTGRAFLAACGTGAMQRCVQIAERFASRRSVATGRLLDNGVTQKVLADCAAAARTVEALVFSVADRLDHGGPVPDEFFFACKIIGCELAGQVVDQCVQLMGARGFVDTDIVGKYFRDFRVLRIFEGATEAMSVFIGTRILRDLDSFHTTMVKSFGTTRMGSDLKAGLHDLVERAGTGLTPQQSHVLARAVGDVACWGITAAAIAETAENSRTDLDVYAAYWAAQKLEQRLVSARSEVQPALALSADALAMHIAKYVGAIGDTQQSHGGERRTLDAFLQRHAE